MLEFGERCGWRDVGDDPVDELLIVELRDDDAGRAEGIADAAMDVVWEVGGEGAVEDGVEVEAAYDVECKGSADGCGTEVAR